SGGKLPWKIAIMIDATIQNRSSLHAENVKRFNHGKGFVIGHQLKNNMPILLNLKNGGRSNSYSKPPIHIIVLHPTDSSWAAKVNGLC
ncbi:MAG: hypothetical protein KJP07_15730, partial [Desulfatitalea sp.]|nr:hypothetical protein [Desulfatitalea sp.]